jgi:predicted ribosome quality control (RQC) complex YloA/Tae2 family protein
LDILLASNSPVEIEDFLKEHGEAAPGTRNAPAKRLPFTRYTAPSGIDILVGRGARDNDALTFKIAHKEDWWLHARGVPGSHVILKTGKREPEQRDLLEAARLAARNSNAKHAGIVVVQYCQRKHVSKPKGSPPGVVLVHQEKTLTIDLSELT